MFSNAVLSSSSSPTLIEEDHKLAFVDHLLLNDRLHVNMTPEDDIMTSFCDFVTSDIVEDAELHDFDMKSTLEPDQQFLLGYCESVDGTTSIASTGHVVLTDYWFSDATEDVTQHLSSFHKMDDYQPTGGKQTVHLWQFLKELLTCPSIYSQSIRWVDQRQGIFKIENSYRVAKLWGERKNRPGMNYDKLSRSLRQYYRKGIIRKATGSQRRLTYQFCSRYL